MSSLAIFWMIVVAAVSASLVVGFLYKNGSGFPTPVFDPPSGISAMTPEELLDMVRDPMMTENLRLAKKRGELGVISRETRDIHVRTASTEALEMALADCYMWHATYPETDDYALVSWLEAVIADEMMARSLAKISGGIRPTKLPQPEGEEAC